MPSRYNGSRISHFSVNPSLAFLVLFFLIIAHVWYSTGVVVRTVEVCGGKTCSLFHFFWLGVSLIVVLYLCCCHFSGITARCLEFNLPKKQGPLLTFELAGAGLLDFKGMMQPPKNDRRTLMYGQFLTTFLEFSTNPSLSFTTKLL